MNSTAATPAEPASSGAAANLLAAGKLLEERPGMIIMGIPGTDYRLHLLTDDQVTCGPAGRIAGRVHARAKRVDVVGTGGRFIEPVYGRPRRLQGRIIAGDAQANTITINCVIPITCTLTAGQTVADFKLGQLVSFDVESGATFQPVKEA